MPHGESIQNFCVRNKVPYNIFSKWYKDIRKKIVEVKVDGMPSDKETLPSAPGGVPSAEPFHDDMSLFYKLEDRYDEEGISPEERGRRRHSLETKEIMIRLRSRLDMELAKDETERSPYLTEALNYLNKFWDGIFAYQKDGHYPIDNNIAGANHQKTHNSA